ncbi:TRAP transporter substrate-binding protein, partial [Delftia sp. BR1]
MTLSRRHVLHGAAACALPLALSQRSAFASKAEFRYKYANNLPA